MSIDTRYSVLRGNSENRQSYSFWRRWHIDLPLLFGLLTLSAMGLFVLYSAESRDIGLVIRQAMRMALAFGVMFLFAQSHPQQLYRWAPWIYATGLVLLLAVLLLGEIGKGAQRWLNLGFVRFQPSEVMKVAVPLLVARYLATSSIPPKLLHILIAATLIVVPTFLIIKQPDLGTSLLIASSGVFVLLFAGIRWRLVFGLLTMALAAAPFIWNLLHDYQKQRVMTFLNPENDPLGSGYHIIQSKIAIGSGGFYGKGWLNGTQSHLEFLPERSTDFVFAVFGEEFGLLGSLILLSVYLFIIFRGLYIAMQAQDAFSRLLAGSLVLTFFIYVFVNISMVTGMLPVVGLPLPLISFGGTSMVTLMASFGILMSIHSHRKLIAT